ncbi:MAG: translocation/assembly module TamB domain-containing protein [Myxococcota bacterium]|nr:translocation/assembly module TamB domain-containing protein [Myxococcota bacterium]
MSLFRHTGADRWQRIRQAFKAVLVLLALIVFLGTGFLLWSFRTGRAVQMVRAELLGQLYEECEVIAGFESVEVDLFPPQISLSGVSLADRYGGQIVALEEAILRVAVLPFFYGRFQLLEVAALAPSATLVLDYGRIVNLPSCLSSSKEGGSAPVLGVDQLTIERGRFRLIMPQKFEARLDDIDIALTSQTSGGANLNIGVDDGIVKIRGQELVVQRFRLLSHIAGLLSAPRALSFQSLEAEIDGVKLKGQGAFDFLGPVLEAKLNLDVELEALRKLSEKVPELSGKAAAEISVTGPLLNPRLVGRLSTKNASIKKFGLADELAIDFRADRNGIQFREISARLGDGTLTGKGKLSLAELSELPIELELQTNGLPLGALISELGQKGAWVDGSLNGTISAKGRLKGPTQLAGTIQQSISKFKVLTQSWELVPPADKPLILSMNRLDLSGNWSTDGRNIDVTDAEISSGGTEGSLSGRFALDAIRGMTVVSDFRTFDFLDLGPIAGLDLTGFGDFAFEVTGPYNGLSGIGSCGLEGITVGQLPFGDASGTLGWRGRRMTLESIEGRLGQSKYEGDVTIDFGKKTNLTILGTVPRGRIKDLLIPIGIASRNVGNLDGEVRGRFDLQGSPRFLTGPIELDLNKIQIFNESFDRGQIVGRIDSGSIVAESADFRKKGARINSSVYFNPHSKALRIRARTRDLSLQKLDLVSRGSKALDGPLAIFVDAKGTVQGMTGTVAVTLDHIKAGEEKFKGGRLKGSIRGANMSVAGGIFGNKLGIDGNVRLEAGLPFTANMKLEEFNVPKFIGALKYQPTWTGLLVGTARLKGKLSEVLDSTGNIFVERALFEAPKLTVEANIPSRMRLSRGLLDIDRLLLTGPTTRLQVSGKIGRRLIDSRITGRLDLKIAETLLDFVDRSAGQLALETVVRGSFEGVDLVGTGKVSDGSLELKALPGTLTGLSADLMFSQSTVIIQKADGKLDGGEMALDGQVFLDGLLPSQVELNIGVDSIRPQFTSAKFDLTGILTGRVFLEGKLDQLLLRGNISASRPVLTPKFDWRSLVGDPMQRLAPKVYDPSREIMSFDVGIELAEPLRVKNETADIYMNGRVTMTGTNQRLGLIGNATINEGRVGILGREYEFESGVIDFKDRNRFYPRYDLSLNAQACGSSIDLTLVGTLDRFDTSFVSRPEMSDTDIVSCLVRGVRIRDLENLSGSALSGAAAGLAGEALWRFTGVDRQVRKVLPVDQIELTTEYSSRARLYEPRILIAKEVLEGQVRLEFSSSLFNTDDQSVSAHYRVTPSLSLQSGWNSSEDMAVGDLGLDLKYRWEW